jgi:hypothetical protein
MKDFDERIADAIKEQEKWLFFGRKSSWEDERHIVDTGQGGRYRLTPEGYEAFHKFREENATQFHFSGNLLNPAPGNRWVGGTVEIPLTLFRQWVDKSGADVPPRRRPPLP